MKVKLYWTKTKFPSRPEKLKNLKSWPRETLKKWPFSLPKKLSPMPVNQPIMKLREQPLKTLKKWSNKKNLISKMNMIFWSPPAKNCPLPLGNYSVLKTMKKIKNSKLAEKIMDKELIKDTESPLRNISPELTKPFLMMTSPMLLKWWTPLALKSAEELKIFILLCKVWDSNKKNASTLSNK